MFDDNKEPEDIFSEADKVAPQVASPTSMPIPAAPPAPAPAPAPAPVPAMVPMAAPTVATPPIVEPTEPRRSVPWKPIALVLAILVVMAAAFYLSVRILGSRTPVTPEPPGETWNGEQGIGDREQEETSVPVVEPEVKEEVEEPVAPAPSTIDTDKDGLTDEEETVAGTSSRSADTDGDGLFDPEEVNTWKTDPVNPDTDGDGYLDGQEVSGGYNPKGSGKLLGAPTESD